MYYTQVLKVFSIFLIIAQNILWKNNWKHLKFVLKNMFLDQIIKKLFFVKS